MIILIDHWAEHLNGGPHSKNKIKSSIRAEVAPTIAAPMNIKRIPHCRFSSSPYNFLPIGYVQPWRQTKRLQSFKAILNLSQKALENSRSQLHFSVLILPWTITAGPQSDKSRCLPGQYRWLLRNRYLRGDRLAVPTSSGWILVTGRV